MDDMTLHDSANKGHKVLVEGTKTGAADTTQDIPQRQRNKDEDKRRIEDAQVPKR